MNDSSNNFSLICNILTICICAVAFIFLVKNQIKINEINHMLDGSRHIKGWDEK